MVDGLDVVAVRIQQERGNIAWMVGSLTWGAVVPTPSRQAGMEHPFDGLSRFRLKRKVDMGDLFCRNVDIEFIGIEKTRTTLTDTGPAQRGEYRTIKPVAGLEIGHAQVNVID